LRKQHNPEGIVLTEKGINDGWSVLNEDDIIKAGDTFMMMDGQFNPIADCSSSVGMSAAKAYPGLTVFRCLKAGSAHLAPITGTDRRRAILQQVESCVCRDRQNSYGDAEDNFTRIAALWNIQFGHKLKEPLSSKDVALAMIHVKCARAITSPGHLDNAVDGAGYFVCLGGIIENEKGKQ
jgi:hypothetical protein